MSLSSFWFLKLRNGPVITWLSLFWISTVCYGITLNDHRSGLGKGRFDWTQISFKEWLYKLEALTQERKAFNLRLDCRDSIPIIWRKNAFWWYTENTNLWARNFSSLSNWKKRKDLLWIKAILLNTVWIKNNQVQMKHSALVSLDGSRLDVVDAFPQFFLGI